MTTLNVGRHSYAVSKNNLRGGITSVHIGNFCAVAEGVIFDCGFQHNVKNISAYPFNFLIDDKNRKIENMNMVSKGDIHVGNDVWIGANSMIMSGITIGSGAVIGAHSVVTHDVRPYEIVAGIPARLVRKRFSDEIVDKLLKIAWWDWPDYKILKYSGILMSDKIEDLLKVSGLKGNS